MFYLIKEIKPDEKKPIYTLETPKNPRPPFFERLTRNVFVGALILLTVLSLKGGTSGAVEAVQASLHQDWDERLGRLTFVSNLFPDAVEVFFPSSDTLTAPCFGETTHGYSADEPYLGFDPADKNVYPARAGEVANIAHGEDEERIVELAHGDGLSTVYYNLAEVYVKEGQTLNESDVLGAANQGGVCLEARRDGLPFDPTGLMTPRARR